MLRVHCLAALRSGWRSRGARVVFALGVVVLLASWLGGTFSARQPQTVALDVGVSAIRIVGLLLGLYWVQELVFRDIERRTVLFVLAYPQARWQYLVGRFCGVLILLAMALFVMALCSALASHFAVGSYQQATKVSLGAAYGITMLGVYLDLMVILSFALLVATVATVPMMPFFLGLAFALAARTLGPALAYLLTRRDGAEDLAPVYLPIFDVIQWVLPDLSRLDLRDSVLYGVWPSDERMIVPMAGALLYAVVLVLVSILLFRRRSFS